MTPPYHLRPNKAIDRFLLVETLRKMFRICHEKEYTYYSFAGAFLEDSKLMQAYFPEMKLTSLEKEKKEWMRQEFHRFCSHIKLLNQPLEEFLVTFVPTGKQVFWLDYTDFKSVGLEQFGELLTKVSDLSVVRITVQCTIDHLKAKRRIATDEEWDSILEKEKKKFETEFENLCPSNIRPDVFEDDEKYRNMVQTMIQKESQKRLPAPGTRVFQIVQSSYYRDTVGMLSVTGVVVPQERKPEVLHQFSSLRLGNINWNPPKKISVPVLSVKERLQLQKHLPLVGEPTADFLNSFGYLIGEDASEHEEMMRMYADFYGYFPYFAKISV